MSLNASYERRIAVSSFTNYYDDDQFRIEAPGAHDSDVPRRRAFDRRRNGSETGALRGQYNNRYVPGAGSAAGRAQADHGDTRGSRAKFPYG